MVNAAKVRRHSQTTYFFQSVPLTHTHTLRLPTELLSTQPSACNLQIYKDRSREQPKLLEMITMQHIESTSRPSLHVLRAKVSIMPLYVLSRFRLRLLNWFKVALREPYRCAITKGFDIAHAENLIEEGHVELEDFPENRRMPRISSTFCSTSTLTKRLTSNLEIVRDVLITSHT